MEIIEDVRSYDKPNNLEFNANYVYINEDISEVPQEERSTELEGLEEGQELSPLYKYKVTRYEKDEFLLMLSKGQVTLNNDVTDLQDMILELSGIVYA